MQSGRLHHRVAIQAATETRDAHGQTLLTWATVANRWARVEPLVGREQFQAQQSEGRMPTRITLRRYAGLTPQHRIVYGTRVYNLVSVPDAGPRGAMMELIAIEDV